ncbi:hypothetical protein Tco_0600715, partial [Tanacetum coccineum]
GCFKSEKQKGLKVVACDEDGNISKTTTNVVYKEVLQGTPLCLSDNVHRLILLQELKRSNKFASYDIIQKLMSNGLLEGDEIPNFPWLFNQKRRYASILQFYKRKFQAQDSQVMFSNLPHSHSLNCMDRETLERQSLPLKEGKEAVWDLWKVVKTTRPGWLLFLRFEDVLARHIQKDLLDFVNYYLLLVLCLMVLIHRCFTLSQRSPYAFEDSSGKWFDYWC